MKRKKGKNVTEDKEFIPKEKQVIHLDQGKFIPFKQTISRDASLKKPFIPSTIEDALARQKKKDK
jgi:hypothetical protein|tara:strand:+ start:66 stop:260 length:195 start_codon:yes stop_codon:yes gene_type:complete